MAKRTPEIKGAEQGRWDYDFRHWWKENADAFPGVHPDDAMRLWTAGYSAGYEWGVGVATPADW